MHRTRMLMTGLAGLACMGVLATPSLADTIELTGVVRDFKRGDWDGGHPDFETAHMGHMGGYGHVTGLVGMELSEDHKPVYAEDRPNKDTIYSADSFAQWYRDVPDVNLSMPLTLTLDNNSETPGGIYTYESNAFWPVDNQMFGNQSLSKNFHFTFQLHTEFTYSPGQRFTFIGDDDVWVYVNGVRVIDLGGVHPAVTGSVLLFDGKAFVENEDFPAGGMVAQVDNALANKLENRWENLGLPGDCPVDSGDKYIDLYLTEGATDTRAQFNEDNSVTVYSAKDLSNVVLKFEDGTEQKFDNLSTGTSATFTGSDANDGKTIVGVWIKSGNNQSGDGPGKGHYHAVDGGTSIECTLDFFFAERHTTQSNFRIDTSMQLESLPPSTVSPLYD